MFVTDRRNPSGLASECKRCKTIRLSNRGITPCEGQVHCGGCKETKDPDEFHLDQNRWTGLSGRCKQCVKDYHLHRNFGIDHEQFTSMEAEQGGRCAICNRPPSDGKALSVDHDHVTNAVRGLLCSNCNFAIGLLGDDPEIVESAAAYLRLHVEKSETKKAA